MHTLQDHGLITIVDPGADKPLLEQKMLQCVHCGGQFPHQPGSGKIRGFCMNCNGPVCGPGCAECVPVEQYLSNLENGREANFKPVFSSLSGATMWLPPSI